MLDIPVEYNLKNLRVRWLALGKKNFGGSTVRLETDVVDHNTALEGTDDKS